ncbi:MAG TPA: DMT family transporter [Candidatus Deferrimicrobium sp.]|nr:DMT family transporter [Candidatus Deferrimicrobium sp.]
MALHPVRSTRRSELLLLLAVLLWSTTFAVMKESLGSISPALLVLVRFAIAAAVVYVLFRRKIAFSWRNLLKGLAIGIPQYLGFMLQVTGLTMTTASKNAFITSLSVVVAPVLSFLFLREKRSRKVMLALILAVDGLWIISFGFTLRVGGMGMGDFLTLLSALAFGVVVFMIHLFSDRDSFYASTFFQLLTVAICSLVYSLATKQTFVVNPVSWPSLLYLAIFTTAITLLLQNRFQHDVTVAQASIIYSLEPVFATLLAVLFIGEHMGPTVLVGGILMFVASAIS